MRQQTTTTKTLAKMKMKMQILSTSGGENMEAQGESCTETAILELILVLANSSP